MNPETDKKNPKSQEDLDFEAMMEQRIRDNFAAPEAAMPIADERLREMSKKLPDWSLEPPFTFLK